MNRRNLLQAAGLALLSLVPLKFLRATPNVPKSYLGYNEPYDRSLVRFRQSDWAHRAELFYESIPGKPPVMLTVNHDREDRELMHHILQLNLEYQQKNGPNTSGMLIYNPSTDQLRPYRRVTVAA